MMRRRNSERGLTFLEMVFVVSIFGIMASIVLFQFRDFNQQITLNNLTQDIALRIVEAQKSAISGSLNTTLSGSSALPSYGVYFKSDVSAGADNTQFIYFNDIGSPGNKRYDGTGGCTSECISVTSITTGEYISDICYVNQTTTTQSCASTVSGELSISFTRPFPDASIWVTTGSGWNQASEAYLEITSGRDSTMKKTIALSSIGKVWVYDGAASLFGVI